MRAIIRLLWRLKPDRRNPETIVTGGDIWLLLLHLFRASDSNFPSSSRLFPLTLFSISRAGRRLAEWDICTYTQRLASVRSLHFAATNRPRKEASMSKKQKPAVFFWDERNDCCVCMLRSVESQSMLTASMSLQSGLLHLCVCICVRVSLSPLFSYALWLHFHLSIKYNRRKALRGCLCSARTTSLLC